MARLHLTAACVKEEEKKRNKNNQPASYRGYSAG